MLVFLTLVGAALLALIVVVIYLNDRVNELERRTTGGSASGGSAGGPDGGEDNTWRGLTGKRLWDAMAGKKGVTPLGDTALAALRMTYEEVLTKHIESLFRAGQADARRGAAVQPTAVKTLGSARGTVQSWIPLNHANALYRAGIDSTKADIYEAERARMTLDDTAQVLFSQTGLSLTQPFSDLLLGNGGSLTGAEPGDAGGLSAPTPSPSSPSAGASALGAAGTAAPGNAAGGVSADSAGVTAPGALPAPLASGGMFSASTHSSPTSS